MPAGSSVKVKKRKKGEKRATRGKRGKGNTKYIEKEIGIGEDLCK